MPSPERSLLHSLARLYSIQTAYYDQLGQFREVSSESILALLRALDAPVQDMDDVPNALRERRQFLWRQGIAPTIVAWDGGSLEVKLRLPRELAEPTPAYHLELEDGELLEGICQSGAADKLIGQQVEGVLYVVRRLVVPQGLPLGYHRLRIVFPTLTLEAHLVAAPRHAYNRHHNGKDSWGVFAPLYALVSESSWGAGDFSDLEAFAEWVKQLGGNVVSTLPLLASFLGEIYNPSPYAPASRLFWNELYLDVPRIPEFQRCPVARAVLDSAGFQTDLEYQRAAPLIDYRRLMALKRRILEELVRCLLNQPSERRTSFQNFIETHPLADDYAAFRAKTEWEGTSWGRWPEASRSGTLVCGDYDEAAKQYHLYVQWQADEQMRALGEKTKRVGPALYLDFPLGVNRDGYDVWRQRPVFALAASGGAPPDVFFTKGQNWGFPPLHPERLRQQGYRYYIDCLRHHLRYAGMLRIDHVMGLHRLFWVPEGLPPTKGVYVRYPAEEFYAILNLESHRHRAQIVGENLGTVAPYINATMAKHKIAGMYVGEFGIPTDKGDAPQEVPPGTVASIDTHDTPTFAGFWSGSDIEDRRELGLLTDSQSAVEREARAIQRETLIEYLKTQNWLDQKAPDAEAVLKAWLCHLSAGAADLVLVNLEDLWLEPLPQNVPGTWQERPNWQRRARYRLEEIRQIEPVVQILSAVNDVRKKK